MVHEADTKHGSPLPTAYQPSFLRRFPIVSFGENNARLRAPLRDLILARITSGLYYDIISGGQKLLNEANERFEKYCADYIDAMMPRFNAGRSYKYKVQGNDVDTPDILVKDNNEIVIAIECKAAKLTFAAQYADDPIGVAKKGYDQISNGVFQLWRYFSHVRRGIVTADHVSPNVHGMVLTLDAWLVMSHELQKEVLSAANALADSDQNIVADDRRKIVFCAIHDLESTLAASNEDSFLQAMTAATREDRFVGWILPNIHQESQRQTTERKPFPFKLDDVLPWWKETREIQDQLVKRSPAS